MLLTRVLSPWPSSGHYVSGALCRLSHISHVFLVFAFSLLSVIPSAKGYNGTTSSTMTTDDDVIQEEASSSVDPGIIVVCVTFPVGILVGAAWCYCMTAVCKIRTDDQIKKPSMNELAVHNQRHYHGPSHHQQEHRERSSSLCSSASSSSSPPGSRSPSPLGLPPDIP